MELNRFKKMHSYGSRRIIASELYHWRKSIVEQLKKNLFAETQERGVRVVTTQESNKYGNV